MPCAQNFECVYDEPLDEAGYAELERAVEDKLPCEFTTSGDGREVIVSWP